MLKISATPPRAVALRLAQISLRSFVSLLKHARTYFAQHPAN